MEGRETIRVKRGDGDRSSHCERRGQKSIWLKKRESCAGTMPAFEMHGYFGPVTITIALPCAVSGSLLQSFVFTQSHVSKHPSHRLRLWSFLAVPQSQGARPSSFKAPTQSGLRLLLRRHSFRLFFAFHSAMIPDELEAMPSFLTSPDLKRPSIQSAEHDVMCSCVYSGGKARKTHMRAAAGVALKAQIGNKHTFDRIQCLSHLFPLWMSAQFHFGKPKSTKQKRTQKGRTRK